MSIITHVPNNLFQTTRSDSFHNVSACQDGEPDDKLCLVTLASAVQHVAGKGSIYCTIGNEDIVHVSKDDKDVEMNARVEMARDVFSGRNVTVKEGTKRKSEVSEGYIQTILDHTDKKTLVVHTECFGSLGELLKRAAPKQLANVTILTYGSVNLSWMISEGKKRAQSTNADLDEKIILDELHTTFFDNLEKSGAKLLLAEGFPFLGGQNKITHKNTPLTYELSQNFDGIAGEKWTELNKNVTAAILEKQSLKIATCIVNGHNNYANEEQQAKIRESISELATLAGKPINVEALSVEELTSILNCQRVGKEADKFSSVVKGLYKYLEEEKVFKDKDGQNLKLVDDNGKEFKFEGRTASIYSGVSLKGQALIADQLAAIVASELIEGREKGIASESYPAQFAGMEMVRGRLYPSYEKVENGSLFYLKSDPKNQELTDTHLCYIDVCMATALLSNESMISTKTKEQLLSSEFGHKLRDTATRVKKDYDLPSSYEELSAEDVEMTAASAEEGDSPKKRRKVAV